MPFDLWVDIVWYGDLLSRSYSILGFTYHASSHTAIVLWFFMVLPLISFAGAAFSYIRNNERKSHLMRKTLVVSSTMQELPSLS